MKRKWIGFFTGCLLSIFVNGCASMNAGPIVEEDISQAKKGYLVGSLDTKAGNFETPPYIPTKIKRELTELLRSADMLAEGAGKGNILMVYIETSARYIGGASGSERYSELQSRVIIRDISSPCYVATALIVGYNGFGAVLSDFTERNHAQDIMDFIKRVVRND